MHSEVEIPLGINIYNRQTDYITINWVWPYTRSVSYDVRYMEKDGSPRIDTGLTSNVYKIPALTPITCYNISVRAVDMNTGEVGAWMEDQEECTSKQIGLILL